MRIRLTLALALTTALGATAAWAVLYPTQPGDYVYYRDADNQVVGQAWIPCYSSEVREWGERTANAVKTHMNCPPPVE
ncbi:DUF6289 family protein [Luteimonas aquatica]|uniref:DUF6289 family protein n=1 Tax=Luteimonas aquatica TaxID=450364 RepID=UPI001F5750C7|nr:DUF6289 family protein [Luteimonas aquatica]